MKNELITIYKLLKDLNYHSSIEIAKHINFSDRTTRKYLKELAELLESKNIILESKPRYGYRLIGNLICEEELFLKSNKIPNSVDERVEYLIMKLILSEEYIKLENISEEIYVSVKTLSQDLKKIENKLEKYFLEIERKPYYGIKLKGLELNKRNLLIDLIENKINENSFCDDKKMNEILEIASYINKFFKENNVKISDLLLQNFSIAIYVSLLRNKEGYNLKKLEIEKNSLFENKRKLIENLLFNYIEYKNITLKLTKEDIDYLTIRILSSETISYISLEKENIKDLNSMIEEIIFYVNITFKIDLSNDDDFYKNLYTHLLALTIRLRFGINVENPLLNEIKENMILEYNISKYVCELISKKYFKELSEAEIGYIAVLIHMSKALRKKMDKKKKILIVCPSGRGISKFLIYTYTKLFSEYISLVSSCGKHELMDINLSTFDIIFTLIDLDIKVEKPIYKIDYFLKEDDINRIKNILREEKEDYKDIFLKDLFMYFDKKVSKNEVIKIMSKKIKELKNVDFNLEDLILKREELGLTEINNNVAIPHPIKPINNINVVGIAIFKYPIKWIKNKVSIAIFLCLNNQDSKNDLLYKKLVELVDDEIYLKNLILEPTYINFINYINKLEEKNEL